jgi:hypothetical protein
LLTLSADPIPSSPLHVPVIRKKNLYISNKKNKKQLTYDPLNLRTSNHTKCDTDFLILQALGTWYVLLHSPDVFEETIECMAVTYAYPEGNVGLITVKAFDIR